MLETSRITEKAPFSHLSPEEWEGLKQSRKQRQFRKDEWIAHYGELWPYLLIVDTGKIVAQKESSEGRCLIMTNINPGEMFWGLAFFNEKVPMWVGLQAAEDAQLSLWHRDDFLPILNSNAPFTWELTRSLVERMERASSMVEELAFQPVTGRLAHLLLDHFGGQSEEFKERDLTLDEMASLIGSTREMVCRQLYQLADKGILEINRTEFRIRDEDRLQLMAQKSKG